MKPSLIRFLLTVALVLPSFASAQEPTPPPQAVTAETKARPSATPKKRVIPLRTSESAITPSKLKAPKAYEHIVSRKAAGGIGVLLLGDSIIYWWPTKGPISWERMAPWHPANFGVPGDRTENVLARIAHGELDGIHPKVTVIMIGTNNIGGSRTEEKPEWVAAGIKKIVEAVHEKLPETKVLLLGVFPRGDNPTDPMRKKITEINKLIAPLAAGDKTRFLDITEVFLNDKGKLPRTIMPDVLHPNEEGYKLWYQAIKPTVDEMMK